MKAMHDAWNHIRRSPYQSMAAVLTMFLTMFLAGIFFLVSLTSYFILTFFESKPQITVFFKNESTKQDTETLKKTLEDTGKTASVKFVSKEDALLIYREQNKKDPLLLEMVTADILPASLEVSAKSPAFLNELEPVIRSSSGVEEVVFQKDVVNTLLRWTMIIRFMGLVVVGLFALNAILIIMTVIGMKIALKKEEIEILTLIGASPWYVRMPFILEGSMYGSIGAFFSWLISMGIIMWFSSGIVSYLGMIPGVRSILENPTSMPFILAVAGYLGVLLLAGSLLGCLGSLVALGRYLKTK